MANLTPGRLSPIGHSMLKPIGLSADQEQGNLGFSNIRIGEQDQRTRNLELKSRNHQFMAKTHKNLVISPTSRERTVLDSFGNIVIGDLGLITNFPR